jgi:hypothetical protein
MENIFTVPGPVLDDKGRPYPGYSTKSLLRYDRSAIKAPPWRIKEWDFYQVSDGEKCLQMTIGHASYAGQVSIMLFDFRKGVRLIDKSKLLALPFGSMHMPVNTETDHTLSYDKGGAAMSFTVKGDERTLKCRWDDVEADIVLTRANPYSVVINIPFDESPQAFYYNHKINSMVASGTVKSKDGEWTFSQGAFGLLDWGRGVWPFHNEWYWSNGTGLVGGKVFGFNLGCGFGNTSQATENMLFYDGECYKLGEVDFILGDDVMHPWQIKDKEGWLSFTLTPTYDRTTSTKALWIDNCCHQMFGDFSGHADIGGRVLNIDRLPAFAEHAINNW